ncbi:DUF6886 family protein [Luteolibacter pohnpeiensis]|uniref:DUF6886 family protein n=1 Tax=Luteolibacter pohnpeiensis TaxID=454153 RepID=UPI003CCCD92C
MRLFHVSDFSGITRFIPQSSQGEIPFVWAIDEDHLPNYLFPRQCPRVSYLSSNGHRIIYVEESWIDRIRESFIWIYQMPVEGFRLFDPTAGYFVSSNTIKPMSCRPINDLVAALLEYKAELFVVPSLWPIFDQVTSTQSEFSCIRMRNAQPRRIADNSLQTRANKMPQATGIRPCLDIERSAKNELH